MIAMQRKKGDIVIRVRGRQFDQLPAEKLAAFLRAAADLYAPTRLIRVSETVIVLRPIEAPAS